MGIFDVYVKKPKRNNFPLSYNNLFTIQDFGTLYPIMCKPAVPGDVFKHAHSVNLQFQPMSAHVQHRFRVNTYYFFVPNRILWPKWDEFISNDPSTPLPSHPYILHEDLYNFPEGAPQNGLTCADGHGSLADYLGVVSAPYGSAGYSYAWTYSDGQKINSLPFRAYQKIFNDYFMDEQADSLGSLFEDFDHSGQEQGQQGWSVDLPLVALRSKCWNKDPFTTSLVYRTPNDYKPSVSGTITIEDLRNAGAATLFFERMMRSGKRPQEFLHATFGVKPKDYRLDMAEFLTASSSEIVLGQIMNSEATTGTDAQAQGYSVSTARSSSVAGGFRYKCREFGWYIGLLCIVPDAVYYKGLPRHYFSFEQPTDYPFPDFASLGDQAILNKEVDWYVPQSSSDAQHNDYVFGYAPRYWEYKYYPNEIHGLFKDNAYADYHCARQMGIYTPNRKSTFAFIEGHPNLFQGISYPNGTFMDYDNLKRIFNISSGAFIATCNVFHQIHGLRPFPYSSIPRLKA